MNQINITAIDFNRQGRQGIADAALSPGMLLEQTATGFKVHATAGGENERLIALANLARGADFTSAYNTGETVQLFRALPGDEFYMPLTASATAITALDDLVSNGTGSVIAGDDSEDDQELVCKALESVDNSAGASTVYSKVRAY